MIFKQREHALCYLSSLAAVATQECKRKVEEHTSRGSFLLDKSPYERPRPLKELGPIPIFFGYYKPKKSRKKKL